MPSSRIHLGTPTRLNSDPAASQRYVKDSKFNLAFHSYHSFGIWMYLGGKAQHTLAEGWVWWRNPIPREFRPQVIGYTEFSRISNLSGFLWEVHQKMPYLDVFWCIKWGEQCWSTMGFGASNYSEDAAPSRNPPFQAAWSRFRFLKRLKMGMSRSIMTHGCVSGWYTMLWLAKNWQSTHKFDQTRLQLLAKDWTVYSLPVKQRGDERVDMSTHRTSVEAFCALPSPLQVSLIEPAGNPIRLGQVVSIGVGNIYMLGILYMFYIGVQIRGQELCRGFW